MAITVQSPGRINVIGEHTDYNDGFVLPAAIDKVTTFVLEKNGSPNQCTVTAENMNQTHSFDLQQLKPLASGWQNYVMGVVNEVQKAGVAVKGFNASFNGNVPLGAGMSSSAALEASLAYALNELFGGNLNRKQLARICQLADHNFVGIKSGIMDQFASLMGKKDRVLLLDCRSLEFEYFPLELGNYELLLLNSNVSHELANSEYNTRRAECEEGVAILKTYFPEIGSLRDIEIEQLKSHTANLPKTVYQRCHHVVSEDVRTLAATQAMQKGQLKTVGELMYQSHRSLQYDYAVTCAETDYLVDLTVDKPYIIGSRQMGGGFGGCTINLIEKGMADEFTTLAAKAYLAKFEKEPTRYVVEIGDGTKVVG
ncbi:MAG: galactokinase [Saprospiraceae bacterium]